MTVVDVIGVVSVIANGVFPKASLPNAPFAFGGTHRGTSFGGAQFLHEADFDGFPAIGEIGIARRQRPHTMHMIRQYHPSIDIPSGTSEKAAPVW